MNGIIFGLALLVAGLLSLAQAQSPQIKAIILAPRPVASGGCSQATNWFARAPGLNGLHTAGFTNFLCGLEIDGIGCSNTWDFIHVYATQDSTTALLNLCSASFATVANGTPSWSADQGFTGGSGKYLNPTFVPSSAGGFQTLNSGTFGFYDRTSDTTPNPVVHMGALGTSNSYVQLLGAPVAMHVNEGFGSIATGTLVNTQGLWLITRTGAATVVGYKNGASTFTNTNSSTSLVDITIVTMALNNGGVFTGFETPHQFAADYYGRGLNATEAANFTTRLNALATALGWNTF